jgi:hypothetical protein
MPASGSSFLASDTFLRSCEKWRRNSQLILALEEAIGRLQNDPNHPGLNTEELFQSRGIPIYSARVNLQYRLVFAWPLLKAMVLLHFDNHDEAYDWAQHSRDRIDRIADRATEWRGSVTATRHGAVPRLDVDTPVPVASTEALHDMLKDGMSHYLAVMDDFQRGYTEFDFRERSGLMFIRGGAGTGKTAIAIHRAKHLQRQPEFGRQGIQYLCFNNVLARTVEGTFRAMNGGESPRDIFVATFHGWSMRYLNQRGMNLQSEARRTGSLAQCENVSTNINSSR